MIELDGDQHGHEAAARHDAERTDFLERQGFLVIRFWNQQVFTELDGVLDTIAAAIEQRRDGSG